MKKNRITRLAILLLALTMVVLILVSGTYAKYTSTATGTDSVTVAKWSIGVKSNGGTAKEIAVQPETTVEFNLFDTINDTGNAADEEDVSDNLIAPGTAGSFSLQVVNSSEVTAKYGITYTVTNSENVPLKFSTDNGAHWSNDLTTLNTSIDDTNSVIAIGGSSTATTVLWKWDYEDDRDAADTTLGIKGQTAGGAPTVTVLATITATQVD